MNSFREPGSENSQSQQPSVSIPRPVSGTLKIRPEVTLDVLRQRQQGFLPDHFGFQVEACGFGWLEARMEIQPFMLAPNGYMHAASVIALADTASGYATFLHLPDGARSFTTIELKSNFLSTARSGMLRCVATAAHGGRNTQVWDAVVIAPDGKTMALFRCTQMILYPQ